MWPTGIFIDSEQTVYVSELMRPGISIYDIDGRLLTRWGNEVRTEEDPLFVTLHDITVDSEGSIYVCEVMGVIADTLFFSTRKTRMIQKFIRIQEAVERSAHFATIPPSTMIRSPHM